MNLYLGAPIWAYKGWVGDFYPPGTKSPDYLKEYASRLTTVEGNTTFYAVPSPETLQQWAADSPDWFRFCLKLPRTISHTGSLVPKIDLAEDFFKTTSLLGERLGPMFLQLPPRYSPSYFDDLETFLDAWAARHPLAVEVRHLDWFSTPHNEALNALLQSRNMARVVIDTRPIRSLQNDAVLEGTVYKRLLAARQRKPDVPVFPERTADFLFLRYIGHPRLEENAPFIDEWSHHLARWLREGCQVFVFCHCPEEYLDPWLCREFHHRISQEFPLPALPWDEADARTTRQERLF